LAARRNLKEPERWSAKLRRFSLFSLLSGLLVAATSARYANDANRRALDSLHNPRIEFFPYDWGINDVHSRAQ